MTTYERPSGAHVAERIRAVPGSEEDQHLSELVDQGIDGWRRIDESKPKAQPAPKDSGGKRTAKAPAKTEEKS